MATGPEREADPIGNELDAAEGPTDRITVLIADPHPIFRQGLLAVLQAEPDLEVVAEATEVGQVQELMLRRPSDVVLIDVELPGGDAFELARQIKLNAPRTATIVLSSYDEEEQVFQALRAGASAFFLKTASPAELVACIRRTGAGEYLINESVLAKPRVASRVLHQFQELTAAPRGAQVLFAQLSPRETEILEYIARGNSNKEIARQLKISDQTVKNHITSIMRKLAVNDRTQAVVYALRRGWIKLEEL